ncbi:Carboxymuconolactone decarboxylase family protein [Rosistilla carotiformis]|uniref:Carboxymuconolactone decarboxylase family protein n=1 Tax=Rosistilla carotiformis TaxID=2528017 RepID=A0A518K1I2_9BACT|nr:carboxymuconolactone decarboxylase family protein [Rosistilla carotiformis]QDV71627.1 Carboxymuconolactone decarboxylase family protein [Rosistilla carotiformis]
MIPKPYRQMHDQFPEYMQAYEAFAAAAAKSGPLDAKSIALTKLAISIGAGLEGGTHSHARKALEAGCLPDELRHVAMLSAPTIGFPTMMRARMWVEDVLTKAAANESTETQQP